MELIETREELAFMIPKDGVAVELGVAQGKFSFQLLALNREFKRLYSIDRWSGERGHNDDEYVRACKLLSKFKDRSIVLKHSMEEAYAYFAPNAFDLIYMDGYAHMGQTSQEVMDHWYHKLKPGGIFAGHDYCEAFPKTMKSVNDFVQRHGLELHATTEEINPKTCTYPSWYTQKPE